MPTYEYQCSECNSVFDVFQSIKASPLKKAHCDSCDAVRPVKRLIGTGGAVIFKGSGFYQTDYRSDSYKKKAEAEKSSSTGGDAKPDAKGSAGADAKPASKDAGQASPPSKKGGKSTSTKS